MNIEDLEAGQLYYYQRWGKIRALTLMHKVHHRKKYCFMEKHTKRTTILGAKEIRGSLFPNYIGAAKKAVDVLELIKEEYKLYIRAHENANIRRVYCGGRE